MHRSLGLVLATLVACSKSDPAMPPAPAAPGTTSRASAPDATPAPPPVAVEERHGELLVEGQTQYLRVPFTVRTPVGWGPTGPIGGPPLDGSDGTAAFGARGAGADGPVIVITARACPDCTAEQLLAAQQAATGASARVLRSEVVGPATAIHAIEIDGVRTATVRRPIADGDGALAECVAEGPPTDIWDALVEACVAMTMGQPRPVFEGDVLAAEESKIGLCPGKTTVTYTGNPNGSFYGVEKAGVLIGPGRISVRIADVKDVELVGDDIVKSTHRLDLNLVAAPGREVTSGTYSSGAERPPALASATMNGVQAPDDTRGASPDDCASWVECTPYTSWSGTDDTVEIIARTRTRVCGRFHLKDGAHEAKGEFDLPID